MKLLKQGFAVATLAVLSISAQAASIIPVDVLTATTTTAVDSVKDLAVQGLPLITGAALGWFIVTGVKKLLGKGGIK